MKKRLIQLGSILLITIAVVGVFAVAAHAADGQVGAAASSPAPDSGTFMGFDLFGLIGQVVATLMNWLLTAMGFLLSIAGWLLNFSMNLTLHIKEYVDSTPAIYTTWRAIRDISGIFIIFMLLWAALQLILGLKGKSFGGLIKDIIIVGILINFSFFLAGLGIDASNIVSVQLYNAIAPANTLNDSAATASLFDGSGSGPTWIKDGGISNIFMGALKIQTLYKGGVSGAATAGGTGSSAPTPIFIIFLSGIIGAIIELAAALSFIMAALAFILRFVLLLVLLAFSPIWVAAHVIPQVQEYSKEWSKYYTAMLTFMPVYLLLMYFAMSVLSANPKGLFGGFNNAGITTGPYWYGNLLILGVNAFLVCFLLNMPLVVAAKMGSVATSFINPDKISNGRIAKWVGGWAGSRYIGRPAGWIDKKLANTNMPIVGNNLIGKAVRGATVGALAKNKMGYTYSAEELNKEKKEIKKKNQEIERERNFGAALKATRAGTILPAGKTLKDAIGRMSEKEKLGLGSKKLTDSNILRYLKKSDFDAIKKSDDFTENERAEIADARKKTFSNAVTSIPADTSMIKDMIKAYDGNDLLGFDVKVLSDRSLAQLFNQSHLKTIRDNTNDRTILDGIEAGVMAAVAHAAATGTGRVPVEGWLKKQIKDGTW